MRISVISKTIFASFLILSTLCGCQIGYILKSGYHQALLIKEQEPIEEYLKNPEISSEQKKKLSLILDIKNFSENDLGLKKSSNYTTFVELDRKYVSYIVQVARPFELKYHLWKFPIVGEMPYKGYFTEADANKEAEIFSKDGFDTFVRGVRAYSTLGWFRDPVLSSMMDYDDDELVNLIIHETTHSTLFIKNSADFNEQLATFVGNKGTELYYEKLEGKTSETLKKIKLKNEDETVFAQFITSEVQELEVWYKSNAGKITKEEKGKRLSSVQEKFKKLKFKTKAYEFFGAMKLNNAILLGYKTYMNDLSKFEKVFEKKPNIREFIQTLKKLEKSKDPEKEISSL